MWLGIAKDLGLCAAFALLLWAPLGRLLLLRLGAEPLAGAATMSLAVGMALWCAGIFVLGVAGLLHTWLVAAVAVVLFVYLRLHRHLLPAEPGGAWRLIGIRDRLLSLPPALLSAAYLLVIAGSALAPELSFDALNVHLPYARDSAAAHRLLFVPNNWSSMMPALPLMSYVTAFLFSGAILAKLFNAVCYLACGGAAYFFARRWWGPVHAICAAALFWSCPVALYEATTALIDLPLTLYSGLAVLALLEWSRSGDRRFFWLSAASLGLALSCKYQAVFWVLPFAVVLGVRTLKQRHEAKHLLGLLMRYALAALLVFLPWVIRAWHYTGNPVFPLANGIFHSPYFPPAMEAAARAAYENEGVGRTLAALLALPWTVTFQPGPFRGTLGAVFLAGAALAIFRGRDVESRWGLACLGIYFYTWALTAQEIRYLLPVAPLAAVLTARGMLWKPGPEAPVPGRRAVARAAALSGYAVLVAGCCVALPPVYPRIVKEWTYWHSYKSPWKYLLGRETPQEYVLRDVPSIHVYDFVNRNLARENRILLLNDAFQFYSAVPTLYSFTVEGERILSQTSESGVLIRLEESRITHVLLNYNGIAPLPRVEARKGVYFFLDRDFQEKHLVPVYSNNNVVLYRVRIR